ncbi:uncharacterized protein [Clytia hemisphaerica]|uniref:uncharacterized protein isoform X1 n=1 Tax=Clytia hemisphaerica TaxID=252671 RepID=UPI0034D6726E
MEKVDENAKNDLSEELLDNFLQKTQDKYGPNITKGIFSPVKSSEGSQSKNNGNSNHNATQPCFSPDESPKITNNIPAGIKPFFSPEDCLRIQTSMNNPVVKQKQQYSLTTRLPDQNSQEKIFFEVEETMTKVSTKELPKHPTPEVNDNSPEYLTLKPLKRCSNCQSVEDRLEEAKALIEKQRSKLELFETLVKDLVMVTDSFKSSVEDTSCGTNYVPETGSHGRCEDHLVGVKKVNTAHKINKELAATPRSSVSTMTKHAKDFTVTPLSGASTMTKPAKQLLRNTPNNVTKDTFDTKSSQESDDFQQSSQGSNFEKNQRHELDNIRNIKLPYTTTLVFSRKEIDDLRWKSKSFEDWSKLIGALVDLSFTDEELVGCSAQGGENRSTGERKVALSPAIIGDIIVHGQKKFPGLKKSQIVKCIIQKICSAKRRLDKQQKKQPTADS